MILPVDENYTNHAWHLYSIQLKTDMLKINRNDFIEALKSENIGTSVHFIPLHLHPYYKENYGFKLGDFPVAESVYNNEISLPIYPKMTDKDAKDVVSAVKKIINFYRK
ncbi:MAG: DegT/DnrJ/EryC1/StrS family aminotransferase [Methanobacterium sp. ERen5]|nr:MAG: DegT/DnrJ/EryC1/StrS family aminotransferase [Methanobacterium sp. ERen5]